jgi:hypothetical protein
MTTPWDSFLESDSSNSSQDISFPAFKELYSEQTNDHTKNIQHSLEIYLNLFSQGRSLLHNLRDRKEFYRPDLYEHLYETTMTKLQSKKSKELKEKSNKKNGDTETSQDDPSDPNSNPFKPNVGGLNLNDLLP